MKNCFAFIASALGTALIALSAQAQAPSSMNSGTAASGAAPTEPQIVGTLSTANQSEIEQAKLAKSKAQNKEVKAFADHMIAEHTKNDKQGMELTKKLGMKPEMAEMAQMMKKEAETKMADLKKMAGKEFDKAYIDQQVMQHQTLLTNLEQKFIPSTKNTELRAFLEQTKTHVQKHLDEAKKLQAKM